MKRCKAKIDIRITDNLKKLRKEHDNPQEDSAAHLNISSQAVSKMGMREKASLISFYCRSLRRIMKRPLMNYSDAVKLKERKKLTNTEISMRRTKMSEKHRIILT